MNSRGTTTVQGSQQCIQRCQELPINLCIIFGQYILFDQAELYGLFVLFQICSDHHLNLIYIYYCCFWLFELCYVIMSIICVHCIYMCLHIIVHVYLYNYDKMFIDKLQIVLKSLLTCKIHKSALEYSIIRRYTNVVYYYYYYYYYYIIIIILAPTLPFAYFSFFLVDTSLVHTVVFISFMFKPFFHHLLPHSWILTAKSSYTHFCHTSFQA